MADYDVIVIGAGSAGLVACKVANGLGKKTALIEKRKLGGDCTWFGCVPSKTLIKSANVAHDAKRMAEFGLEVLAGLEINADKVMDHVRDVVRADAEGHTAESLQAEDIDVIFGSPKFVDSHHITVDGRTISAKRFVICTGSHAFIPAIEGLEEIGYLTNETIFDLDRLPESMIILGGGPIGSEMCCALNRLGVKVTVVEAMSHILVREEEGLAKRLMESLRGEGVEFITEHKITALRKQDGRIVATVGGRDGEERQIAADALLIAVGRRANLEGLDLADAGVEFDEAKITVDEHLRTSAENIYAAGDVVGQYLFTHVAEYEAVIAASNACLPYKREPKYENVPWCTFTDPEFARVGMTEKEAREQYGGKVRVYEWEHKDVDRAKTDVATDGVTKVVCDKKGAILGIHVLGHNAAEVMNEGQLARTLGVKFSKIGGVIHAYPSYSDAIRQPAKKCYVDMLKSNPLIKAAEAVIARRNRKRVILCAALFGVFLVLLIGFGNKLGLGSIQQNMDKIQGYVDVHYGVSVLLFIVVYVAVAAFNVPGAVPLTLTSGFLYGTIVGALYANVGATVGAVGAFIIARYIAGQSIQKKYATKLARFNEEIDRNGIGYLLFLRFIPLFPFFLINIVAGLTKVRLWRFVWTTSVGILPGALVYANIGKQIGALESAEGLLKFRFWGAFVILGVFALAPVVYKKVKAYKAARSE